MRKRIPVGIVAALALLLLILDSRTALQGAREGLDLCFRSVVPSLFPFLVLTGMLTSSVSGLKLVFLRPLGRWMGIPQGAEGIFLTGILGGYPAGAQSVHQAYKAGQLTKEDARRMMAFCNNAGPAFLFGILGSHFEKTGILWILWEMGTGFYLPGKLLHTVISLFLACVAQDFLFTGNNRLAISPAYYLIAVFLVVGCWIFFRKIKKTVALAPLLVYNRPRYTGKGPNHAVPKEN